ncbi:MAG: O-antigen ligase family protein [Planctomycetes bacterium]|nr:O-antigen ligase family protein [Planctomycetota bacterium]
MQFFLFLLVNAMLFLRPGEVVQELAGAQIYLVFIVACFILSLPVILNLAGRRFPDTPPIVLCVLALLPAILLSHLSHMNQEQAALNGFDFFKVLIYFILFLCLVTTTSRLRRFLYWTGILSGGLALLAVVQFSSAVAMPEPAPNNDQPGPKETMHGYAVKEQTWDPEAQRTIEVLRLCGTGLFNDPNDLGLVLVTCVPLCLYWLTDRRHGLFKPIWIAMLGLFAYALMLTHSRGSFLALLAGLGTLFYARFGKRNTVILGMIALPALLVLFAGRMTNISTDEGSGKTRIQLWSDGLVLFQEAPLFGIGMEEYRNRATHVAHNSFLHCFTELGVGGGTLFLGAFYLAVRGLWQLHRERSLAPEAGWDRRPAGLDRRDACSTAQSKADTALSSLSYEEDAELLRLHPYLLSMLVTYTVGILFLSRSYVVPTYSMLALVVVYLRMRSGAEPWRLPAWPRFPFVRLAGVSMAFLVATYVFVRMFVRWS